MWATLRSEWGKTWSVNAPWLCLLGTALLIMITATSLANDFVHSITIGENDADASMPVTDAVGPAVLFGLVVFAAFAMLLVTAEYSTGSIRSTLQAQPRRQLVLASKALIGMACGLVIGALIGWAALAGSEAVLGNLAAVTAEPDAAVVGRVAVLLALDAALVIGLAAIIRSAVGTLAVSFILLTATLALPSRVNVWAPGGAASQFLSGSTVSYPLLAGLAVVAGWTFVVYLLGSWSLNSRDA